LLAQRAAQADARAQKQLALRLIGRIRRAAHALMGGAPEADDAAHHALIEVLRSLGSYAGNLSLEAWADRLAARSVVRFARAVRARASAHSSAFPPTPPPAAQPTRSSVGEASRPAASTEGAWRGARAPGAVSSDGVSSAAEGAAPAEQLAPAAIVSGVPASAALGAGSAEAAASDVLLARAAARFDDRPERSARTLEEFLRQLPSAPREALLLREVFAFDVVQTAQLLRLSTSALREQLGRARRSLYERSLEELPLPTQPLPDAIARWFALSDGDLRVLGVYDTSERAVLARAPAEASVTARSLTAASLTEPGVTARDEERARVEEAAPTAQAGPATQSAEAPTTAERLEVEEARLELDPDVRKLQRELRALAQFLDKGRFGRPGARDKKLVEGALSAVRVSSASAPRAGLDEPRAGRDSLESRAERWVQPVSLLLCGLLVLGAFVALAIRTTPNGREAGMAASVAARASGEAVNPTVEALSTAHTVDKRGRLQRGGKPLIEGALMREGDLVSAAGRPGCFVLSPPVDVCLAAGSEARIAQLGLAARSVELLSGRAVVSVERSPAQGAEGLTTGAPFAIVVGELRAEVTDADFGVEIDNDMVVVRALRGTMILSADGDTRLIATAQSAIYRWHQHTLEVAPQLLEKARRDWDLLATRTGKQSSERSSPNARAPQAGLLAAGVARAGLEAEALPLDDAEVAPEPEESASEAQLPDLDAPPEALLAYAKELTRARRWAAATEAYGLLSDRFPQHALTREAWVLQGELLAERLQRPADALAVLDRYLATGGGALDLRARYGRIVALRLLDRPEQERAAVAQFLNLYRSTPQARVLLSAAEVPAEEPSAPEPMAP
jgi:RNA polymerase sigma factor (sigma-70 family)